MNTPIPANTRASIEAALHTGTQSIRAIARAHNVSPSTVTNIAKRSGQTSERRRAQTKEATAARLARLHEQLAELAEEMVRDADIFRRVARSRVVGSLQGSDDKLVAARNAAVVAAVWVDKVLAITGRVRAVEQGQPGGLLEELVESVDPEAVRARLRERLDELSERRRRRDAASGA